MVPQTQTRTVNYTVQKPVYETQSQDYTVMVPTYETREATRTICQPVQVTKTRTIMVPQTQTRTVNYTVQKPVLRDAIARVHRQVPTYETGKQRARMQPMQVTRTRTVMVPAERKRGPSITRCTSRFGARRKFRTRSTFRTRRREPRRGRFARWCPRFAPAR